MTASFPLDLTGVNSSNLIQNELHSVSEAHFRDIFFVVPNLSPFFIDNFRAEIIESGITRLLVEDVDFSFALPYVTGTRTTGKAMYGALTLHNLNLNGIIRLQYQTIGGTHVVDRLFVLTTLANIAYNPRTTIWDVITNAPDAFPPVPHFQDFDSFFGQNELIAKLNEIKDAILASAGITEQSLINLLNTIDAGNLSGLTNFVRKSGDTMTGFLSLHSDPVEPHHAANKAYIDQRVILLTTLQTLVTALQQDILTRVRRSGDTLTGHLTLHANPTQNMHAATKLYVDDLLLNTNNNLNNNFATIAQLNNMYNELVRKIDAISIEVLKKP